MHLVALLCVLFVGALSERLERNILGTSLVTGQIVADSAKWGISLTKNKQVVDFVNDVAAFGDASSDALKIEVENTGEYLQEIVDAIKKETEMYFENIAASKAPDVLAFAFDFATVKKSLVQLDTQFKDVMNFDTHTASAINDLNRMFSEAGTELTLEGLNAFVMPAVGLGLHIKDLVTEQKDIIFLRQNRQDSEARWKVHGNQIIAGLRYAACGAYRGVFAQRIALNANLRAIFKNNGAIPSGSAAALVAEKIWALQCSQFENTQPNCGHVGTNTFWQQTCAGVVNVFGNEGASETTVVNYEAQNDTLAEFAKMEAPVTSGTGQYFVEKTLDQTKFFVKYQQNQKGVTPTTTITALAQYEVKRPLAAPKTFNPSLTFWGVKSRGPFHAREWSAVALNQQADEKRQASEFEKDLAKNTDAPIPETPTEAAHKRAAEFLPGTCPEPQEYARLVQVCEEIAKSSEKQKTQTADERAACVDLLDPNNRMLKVSKKIPAGGCDAYQRLNHKSSPTQKCPICLQPVVKKATAPVFLEKANSVVGTVKVASALQKLAAKVTHTCQTLCPASTDAYNLWASDVRATDLPNTGAQHLTFSQCEAYGAKYEESPRKKLVYIKCVENSECPVCQPRPVPVVTKLTATAPEDAATAKHETTSADYEEWLKNPAPLLEWAGSKNEEDGFYKANILMQRRSVSGPPIIRVESDETLGGKTSSEPPSEESSEESSSEPSSEETSTSFVELADVDDVNTCAGLIANAEWNNIVINVQKKGEESEGIRFRVGGWVPPYVQTQTQAVTPAEPLQLCYRNDWSMRLPSPALIKNMETVRIPDSLKISADWDLQVQQATPLTNLDVEEIMVHVVALAIEGGEPCRITLKKSPNAPVYVADPTSSAMKIVQGEPASVSIYTVGPFAQTKVGATQIVHFNPSGGTRSLKFISKSGVTIGLEYSQLIASKDGAVTVPVKADNQTVTLSSTQVKEEAQAVAVEATEETIKAAEVVVGNGTAAPAIEAPIVVGNGAAAVTTATTTDAAAAETPSEVAETTAESAATTTDTGETPTEAAETTTTTEPAATTTDTAVAAEPAATTPEAAPTTAPEADSTTTS